MLLLRVTGLHNREISLSRKSDVPSLVKFSRLSHGFAKILRDVVENGSTNTLDFVTILV